MWRSGRLISAILIIAALFCGLGARPLNEPDEGRYAGIAAAMLDSGDWTTPRLWGLPHLDKPPAAYWALAASMRVFGRNAWAVRLPLAAAALAAAWATRLLAHDLAGPTAATWAPVILASSLLFEVMARMATTDIILTASIAWTAAAAWRLRKPPDGRTRSRLAWGALAALSLAAGILAKGPAAVALPLGACIVAALGQRERSFSWLAAPAAAGFAGLGLAAPWFAAVETREPGALHYMFFDQAVGHALGTTVNKRPGGVLYYAPILIAGLCPWTAWAITPLRRKWRAQLEPERRAGALFLAAWAGLTIVIFSLVSSKLPAYVLPLFPPAAVLIAWAWFEPPVSNPENSGKSALALALLGLAAAPAALGAVYHAPAGLWLALATGA
jgi:4-amino-4-deoxy-L-arabinose transferase-like glycosyltransferase